MFHHPGIARGRRTSALALAGGVLLAGLTACGDDAADDPATDAGPSVGEVAATEAADWLGGQLTDGAIVNEEFGTPDYGGTVDAIYALEAVGGQDEIVAAMTTAVYENGQEYVAPGEDVWAGNAGKLVALAADHGDDPSDVEGFDALSVLEDRTGDDGRTSDVSEHGDFANSLGQTWAVRSLTEVGSSEAEAARDFLLLQQCEAGFFRQDFSAPKAADQSCDAGNGTASTDATALAVIVLHDLAEDDEDLSTALDAAVGYLLDEQAEDGSFVGSGELPTNANSTGLAGWALQVAGEDDAAAAAAEWVRAHQVPEGCEDGLADAAGAIAYDDAALTAAGEDGLTEKTSYQWQLATAQALPALLATPEDTDPAACPDVG